MHRVSGRRVFLLCLLTVFSTRLPLMGQIHVEKANPSEVSIVIDAPAKNAGIVPDTIFGSFLEPIGNSINHGLSAEILANPSLESGLWNEANREKMFAAQPELKAASNHFALPLPWEPLDERAGMRFARHYGDAANSWQSLEIMGVPGYSVGIRQQVYLPVQRTLRYNVSLYGKHLTGNSDITLLLLSHDDGKVLAQAVVHAGQTGWKKYAATLVLQPGQVQPLQPVEFGLRVEDNERVDIDELSLMPQDAIDGLDPDVVALAKAMNLTELRLGGNFSSYYNWRDGIGPADKRVTRENTAWGIPEYNEFGTDEFLAFCKMIHAAPQFDLNMGTGTPEEAADWVRYIRSHYQGNVLYEIGNELYGKWQTGWIPMGQIAERTLAYSKAVRAVDPQAPIIATGGMPQSYAKWNAAQLTNPPGTFNFLSTHFIHVTNQVQLKDGTPDFIASAAYALPYAVEQDLRQMQVQVDATPGYRGTVHFAMTEWLFNSRAPKGYRVFTNESPSSKNEGGALMAAAMLNTFIRTSPIVSVADMTGILEFAGIWKRREQVYATPAYYAFRLYSSIKGDTILTIKSDSGTYGVKGGYPGFQTMSGIPYVDAVATLSQDRGILTLFCINRDLTKDIPVQMDLRWFHPEGRAHVEQIKAASRYDVNDEVSPRHVVPIPSSIPVPSGGPVRYTLPHESVTVIRFQNGQHVQQ